MAWDYFPEGKKIGGVKVIEQTAWGANNREVRYDVACMECGAHHEMTHAYIRSRAARRVEGCATCRTERLAEKISLERRQSERVSVPRGSVQAGRHLWWPILLPGGRMGGLYDAARGSRSEASR